MNARTPTPDLDEIAALRAEARERSVEITGREDQDFIQILLAAQIVGLRKSICAGFGRPSVALNGGGQ